MRNSVLFGIVAILALVMMSTHFVEPVSADQYNNDSSSSSSSSSPSCGILCNVRCAKAGMKDRCLKYCGICCKICKCVPSGTYGNKHECPCYRDMKNSKGTSKCP